MSNKFQLSGRTPKAELNGLAEREEEFFEVEAPEPLIGIVQIQRDQRTVKDGSDEVKVIAKLTRIEIVEGEEARLLSDRLSALRDARSGDEPLPEVVEPDVQDFSRPLVDDGFAELDPAFGEDE